MIERRLKKTIRSIDEAQRKLKDVAWNLKDDSDILKAQKELDDAKMEIKRAIRDLN